MNTMQRRTKRHAERRGVAAVETAMVLPLCLLFIFGIMEYGRFVMVQQVVTNAAREGCRYAVTHVNSVTLGGVSYGSSTSNVTTVISNVSAGVTLKNQATSIYCSDSLGNNLGTWNTATEGQSICVQITGTYVPLLSTYLHMPASIAVQAQSVMRVEGS